MGPDPSQGTSSGPETREAKKAKLGEHVYHPPSYLTSFSFSFPFFFFVFRRLVPFFPSFFLFFFFSSFFFLLSPPFCYRNLFSFFFFLSAFDHVLSAQSLRR